MLDDTRASEIIETHFFLLGPRVRAEGGSGLAWWLSVDMPVGIETKVLADFQWPKDEKIF